VIQQRHVKAALLGMSLPVSGPVLPALANWPDMYKRQPGMLSHDDWRHYVNLPHTARYSRARDCPDGLCSVETLLQQRAILADVRQSVARRAVALAWVTHLLGDMHQPLHAGKAEDRGGNLTCVVWRHMPSRLQGTPEAPHCSGENLHVIWDSKLIAAVTGFDTALEGPGLARLLQPFFARVLAKDPSITARTQGQWREVIERWHAETQGLIEQAQIYPLDGVVGEEYIQRHYPIIRLQLLRAAVRLTALLRQTLTP
jgi:hypothetical protein